MTDVGNCVSDKVTCKVSQCRVVGAASDRQRWVMRPLTVEDGRH
jgi:hypothetical protein